MLMRAHRDPLEVSPVRPWLVVSREALGSHRHVAGVVPARHRAGAKALGRQFLRALAGRDVSLIRVLEYPAHLDVADSDGLGPPPRRLTPPEAKYLRRRLSL